MKQTLTSIIRNYCKNLTPNAKRHTSIFLFPADHPDLLTGTHVLGDKWFSCDLEYAEAAFVDDRLHAPLFYWSRKNKKYFEAKTFGDRGDLLVIMMELVP